MTLRNLRTRLDRLDGLNPPPDDVFTLIDFLRACRAFENGAARVWLAGELWTRERWQEDKEKAKAIARQWRQQRGAIP